MTQDQLTRHIGDAAARRLAEALDPSAIDALFADPKATGAGWRGYTGRTALVQ